MNGARVIVTWVGDFGGPMTGTVVGAFYGEDGELHSCDVQLSDGQVKRYLACELETVPQEAV